MTNQSAEMDIDAVKSTKDIAALWLSRIKRERDRDKHKSWLESSKAAYKIYECTKDAGTEFNILHSITRITAPSLYNKTPAPDIRRRFNDEGDTEREFASVISRIINFSLDEYDFDDVINGAILDMLVTGRGVVRAQYSFEDDNDGVGEEKTSCEHVAYDDFVHHDAPKWGDVEWVAFRLMLNKEKVRMLNEKAANKLSFAETNNYNGSKGDEKEQDKCVEVWEVWCKTSKARYWVCSNFQEPLKASKQLPKFNGFFPCPKPIYAIKLSNSLDAVLPYHTYQHLANEIEGATKKINSMLSQIKIAGVYASDVPEIKQLVDAPNGTLLPSKSGFALLAEKGGIAGSIAWFPIEQAIMAIKELYEQREGLIQKVYDITGISDIMRGSSNPNETLGAQNIKVRHGSIRLHEMQSDIVRFCRDLFRLKTDVICSFVDKNNILRMGDLEQSPTDTPDEAQKKAMLAQGVVALIGEKGLRQWKIDIETDSTVKADTEGNQAKMQGFLSGAAAYISSTSQAVQAGVMPAHLALSMFASFARSYDLGKDVNRELEEYVKQAKDNPQFGQQAAQAQNQAAQAKAQGEAARVQRDAQKHAQDMQRDQQRARLEEREITTRLQAQAQELEMKMSVKQQELMMKMQGSKEQLVREIMQELQNGGLGGDLRLA